MAIFNGIKTVNLQKFNSMVCKMVSHHLSILTCGKLAKTYKTTGLVYKICIECIILHFRTFRVSQFKWSEPHTVSKEACGRYYNLIYCSSSKNNENVCFQPLKCEYLLFFFITYDDELSIFGFGTLSCYIPVWAVEDFLTYH